MSPRVQSLIQHRDLADRLVLQAGALGRSLPRDEANAAAARMLLDREGTDATTRARLAAFISVLDDIGPDAGGPDE